MLLAVACSSFVPPGLGRYAFESRRTTKVQMSSKAPLRREVLQLGALGLLGSTLPLSPAEAEELELVVSQAQLLANLASAPTRNIIITGANSGVGLAGAKLLTAAGHSVTLACRTQAKADAAADACNAYAASTLLRRCAFHSRDGERGHTHRSMDAWCRGGTRRFGRREMSEAHAVGDHTVPRAQA